MLPLPRTLGIVGCSVSGRETPMRRVRGRPGQGWEWEFPINVINVIMGINWLKDSRNAHDSLLKILVMTHY